MMSEPFDSKYKLFKQIGVPFSGMNKDNTDTLEHDGSHLTIRDDLVEDGLAIPVHFLDYKENTHVEHTDTLNIHCIFSTDGEELYEGMGIIVRITDPSRVDKYGQPWKDRMAFAHSIDFDWN